MLPAQMEKIDAYAFRNCTVLQKIALPEGISAIGRETFKNCISLQAIYIPSSIKRVEQEAFANCRELNAIYYQGNEEMWNNIVISTNTTGGNGPYSGNKCLTNSIMNRYWNQTAASIGY